MVGVLEKFLKKNLAKKNEINYNSGEAKIKRLLQKDTKNYLILKQESKRNSINKKD